MKKEIFQKIEVPEGVEATLEGNLLKVKGPEGENERIFKMNSLNFEKKDNEIIIGSKKATKKEKKMINTITAHIKSMIKGVQEKFEYQLKIGFSHFPITVDIKEGEAIIKNFLGEKMSQDVVADALNMIRNAKNAGKESIDVKRISKVLIEVLKIMKQHGAIKKYKINSRKKSIEITIGDLFTCKAIKPRFSVNKDQIEKYRRRYLPARNLGIVIISTNKGLKTHEEVLEEGTGGSLIAYFY